MIIVSKESLPFLLAGRVLTVELERPPTRPFSKHRTYAVGLVHNKPATYRVHVIETVENETGLTIKIKHAPGAEDVTMFLAPKSGYTTAGDVFDAGAVPPKYAVRLLADEAREKYARANRQDQINARFRSLALRFKAAQRAGDFSVLREIRREIEELERDAA